MSSASDTLHKVLEAIGTTRDDETPMRYRYRCLACSDRGVENCQDPNRPAVWTVRPCTHCPRGAEVWTTWAAAGPYRRMSDGELHAIRGWPCDHSGDLRHGAIRRGDAR